MLARRPSPGSSEVPRAVIMVMAVQETVAVCACAAGIGSGIAIARWAIARMREITGAIARAVRIVVRISICQDFGSYWRVRDVGVLGTVRKI